MKIIDDFKETTTTKKVIIILLLCCIGILILAVIFGGLTTDKNTSTPINSKNNNDTNDSNKIYKDGTYKIGSDLPAGEYKFTQTSPVVGYVERASDSKMELDSIISNDVTQEQGATIYVTVNEGEYLKIQGGELTPA